MALFHLSLLFITLYKSVQSQCTYTEDENCLLDAECSQLVVLNYIINYDTSCNSALVHSNGESCRPVKLRYTQTPHGTSVPKYSRPNYHRLTVLSCIINLDLSNDEHSEFPYLAEMSELKLLNLSFNSLTTAKLSSVNNLPQLQEIDLSHNTIHEFDTVEHEYIFGSLNKLNISYNNLVQIKDAIFDNFANMQYLDMSHNKISDINAFSFEGIKKLYYLNLAHNKISDINGSLFRFTQLKYLFLNNNNIRNISLKDFEKLINLEEVDLSSNVILIIEKNVFNAMPYVRVIKLNNNQLVSLESQMFLNTSALNSIDLSYNEIKLLPKLLFYGKNISSFDIQKNYIEGALTSDTFKGLSFIMELDMSQQHITSIEEFAFIGATKLIKLFLNHNNISFVSSSSFNNLRDLTTLDLSNNQIVDIDGRFNELKALQYLAVKQSLVQMINKNCFQELTALEFLDVSHNKISRIEAQSFEGLNNLTYFDITGCPLTGALETNTFTGLNLVPILDISNTHISIVQNGTFNQMLSLEILNLSRSSIKEIGFNAFFNTSVLNTLDLSYNLLKFIDLNTSALFNLKVLYINHNFISDISSSFFIGIPLIDTLNLSFNSLKNLPVDAFSNFKELRLLDLSFNKEIHLNVTYFEVLQNLRELSISGISAYLSFNDSIKDLPLTNVNMSYLNIINVTSVGIFHLENLNTMILNNNKIKSLEIGAFSNLSRLSSLDLSFNEINVIQPGVFKDNTNLNVLNISHNQIASLSYGVFRGLVYLSTLDLSYNDIQDLENEQFYDVQNLQSLIMDYNKITKIVFDVSSFSLTMLSIGGNHIPCEMLVKLKRSSSLTITAIKLDESTQENVDGVTCYGRGGIKHISFKNNSVESDGILSDIRDILLNLSARKATEEMSNALKPDSSSTKQLEKLIFEQNSDSERKANVTNSLLERILKIIVAYNSRVTTTQLPLVKENATFENILPYLDKVKEEMENSLTIEKEKIMSDINDKIALIHQKLEETSTVQPLIKSGSENNNTFLFLDICVGLILLIVVCFFIYKMYECVILPSRRSYSTQHIVHTMDNSDL